MPKGQVVGARVHKGIIRFLYHVIGAKFSGLDTGGDGFPSVNVAEWLKLRSLRIDGIVVVGPKGRCSNGGPVGAIDSFRRCDAIRRGDFADETDRQERSNAQRLTNCRVYFTHLA